MPTKTPAAAVPADKPPRKAVDKLPAGSVRVGLDTVVLTEERANALYFVQTGSDDFSDRRKVAAEARNAVVRIVEAALNSAGGSVGPLDLAVAKLAKHQHDKALAEAERAEQEAIAKANALRAKLQQGPQVSPLAERPAGEVNRKSATGA